MATLVLGAVGAAVGGAFGGGVLGLSSMVLGRAVGATVGQAIDRRVFGRALGGGSDVVEHGRIDRFRLAGASEGARVAETYGRMRVGGQVIWASRFREKVRKDEVETGGKGGEAPSATVKSYSYSVSLAVALGEGRVARLGRIWADGNEISPRDLNLRLYPGDEDQLPDPKIAAVEGADRAPAYRGTAYVVIEDLALERFGNRVPQFNFEVVRPEQPGGAADDDLAGMIRAVALVPGTGEYALATRAVHVEDRPGRTRTVNVNSAAGVADLRASLDVLRAELPAHRATSLVVSWFGDDLRAGECRVRPKVEQTRADARNMPWRVSGISRSEAEVVPYLEGRPVYGGTPADASVVEALVELQKDGRGAMFYPFLLMEQMAGNTLTDPWTGAEGQPPLPWRGRITTSLAPRIEGSTDGTETAVDEVRRFFGAAGPGDFSVSGTSVEYRGPAEASYRRFILHYAHLCAAAGGVEAFCIGSELRGLTQIRGPGNSYPAVTELRALAGECRTILGPAVRIGYAADWSEYFGHRPQDGSGDVIFHLDPLWADPAIDFVGIDNYLPLSDWRDGEDHLDAAAVPAIYDLSYLRGNIEGGEGYDWYYASAEAADAQERTPIADGAHGEDWLFRVKDIRSWWSNLHYDRPGGVRSDMPTAWVPSSKPIWFTEIGCGAIDKGTNAPNKFWDPKSSESGLPPYSNGRRDDFLQMQALIAQLGYWADPATNPTSDIYGGPMVDLDHAFVWAWDARPYPNFPNDVALWSDGANYSRGHWLNGRTSSRSLASVVAEICRRSGIERYDVSRLWGVVRGFAPGEVDTGRAALQPLMLAYGFDAVDRDGVLHFRTRTGRAGGGLGELDLVETDEVDGRIERTRAAEAEIVGRVRVSVVESEGSYQVLSAEAAFPEDADDTVTNSDLPILMTGTEARAIAERWLTEARVARDAVRFALPPSRTDVAVGDVVTLAEKGRLSRYRLDQIDKSGLQIVQAVRVDAAAYTPAAHDEEESVAPPAFVAAAPVLHRFLDLPLLTGAEVPHAPHVAVTAEPWPGAAMLWKAGPEMSFAPNAEVPFAAVMGETLTDLPAAVPGLLDRGPALRVRLYGGGLDSVDVTRALNGANAAALGDGAGDWEVFQFLEATLVAEDVYDLRLRLRGQAGTDAVMPQVWPAGTLFVRLDGAPVQVDLTMSERGLPRTWRVGPATRPVDDPVHTDELRAFDGVGLRPFAPVHLRLRLDGFGGLRLSWVRRTRIDGDSWVGLDVPLGEEREIYLVRVERGGTTLRDEIVTAPAWLYSGAARSQDGPGPVTLAVAQMSDRYGPGPFRRIAFDG